MRWGVNSLVVTLHIPTAQRDDGLICSVPNTQHHQQQAMPMRTRHGTMNLLIAQLYYLDPHPLPPIQPHKRIAPAQPQASPHSLHQGRYSPTAGTIQRNTEPPQTQDGLTTRQQQHPGYL